ncbi:ABC transporter substrate-binding protein [Nocardioides mangrovi]|uniref:Thiamine pyrimidine synthase n=1 Tax=Nocardioides mangrovi TaxID=2874580 RepID=A0ABS7UFS8_9ACTN|nr:ABC transporter substrate-binding protein [Nocardioides mangrovi]MBZ5739497.1 ABC transporter substrate-binding protein [Nocardioides mangrovi]
MKRTRRLAIAVAIGVLGSLLAACGSDSDGASSSGSGELTKVRFALDWTPNTNHTGLYVAIAKGYFEDAGIDLEVLPYNNSYPDTLIDAGSAEFGIGFQDTTTVAIASGAKVESVMALIQHWATAIGVRADDDDIQSPKDLDGKTYAGFGSQSEGKILQTVIKNDGGTGDFKSVTLGTSAYEALYSGKVDFTVPFMTWEGIEADLRGEPMKYFKYTDYGFPDNYAVTVDGNTDWMADHPDVTKAFVGALQKGYEYAQANPDDAAQILIDQNKDVLTNTDLVMKSQEMLAADYMLDDDGKFGTQTEEQWAALGKYYYDQGLLTDANGDALTEEPDWSTFFTDEYLSS